MFLKGFFNAVAQQVRTLPITVSGVILIVQIYCLNHKAVIGLLSGPVITWVKSLPF